MSISIEQASFRYPTRARPGRAPARHADHRASATRDGWALDRVSTMFGAGEVVAVVGANGSGKSTLLSLAAGVRRPSSGTVRWHRGAAPGAGSTRDGDSVDASPTAAVRAQLGVVFQSVALDPMLTVEESLRLAAATCGVPRASARARLAHWAARLGFADRLGQRVGELSGGLARRVDLARALIHEPRWVVMDEPTTGLDEQGREALWEVVRGLIDNGPGLGGERAAVALSTHDLGLAARCDRVVMLHAGALAADDAPRMLCASLGPARLLVHALPSDPAARDQCAGIVRDATSGGVRGGGLLGAFGTTDRMTTAAAALVALGASVEVGPPTLADVLAVRSTPGPVVECARSEQ